MGERHRSGACILGTICSELKNSSLRHSKHRIRFGYSDRPQRHRARDHVADVTSVDADE